jgi:uncharacterized protein (TIGR03437 family)
MEPTVYWQFSPLNIRATAGQPGTVRISQGNNQSANAGQTLPAALVAEVLDASGQPLAGIPVTWSVTPSNAANLFNRLDATDVNGRVSTNVSLSGNASGAIQVRVAVTSDTSRNATFTITAIPPVSITRFEIVSGNNQSAAVNTAFGQPLVVQVASTAGGVANIPVQFSVGSGSVSLSATNVNTDSSGRAQVTVQAGSVTGPAVVTASLAAGTGVGNLNFNLTVLPPAPTITSSNFVNGADLQANSLSPCSIGAITAPAGTLGLSAAGLLPLFPSLIMPASYAARLSIGGITAPILRVGTNYQGRDEIDFQVPCNVSPGSSVMSALTVGGGTTQVNLNIQAASPGVFQALSSDGTPRALVVRPDGSFASLENPARRGETEIVYVTGLGATNPAVGTLSVPPPGTNAVVQGTVVVGMQGGGLPFTSARLSQDIPGVYVVAFQIPADAPTGNNLTFSIAVIPQGSSTPIYSGTTRIAVQ